MIFEFTNILQIDMFIEEDIEKVFFRGGHINLICIIYIATLIAAHRVSLTFTKGKEYGRGAYISYMHNI